MIPLDLRNSGDTAGDRASVVGYGAFALMEPASGATRRHGEAHHRSALDHRHRPVGHRSRPRPGGAGAPGPWRALARSSGAPASSACTATARCAAASAPPSHAGPAARGGGPLRGWPRPSTTPASRRSAPTSSHDLDDRRQRALAAGADRGRRRGGRARGAPARRGRHLPGGPGAPRRLHPGGLGAAAGRRAPSSPRCGARPGCPTSGCRGPGCRASPPSSSGRPGDRARPPPGPLVAPARRRPAAVRPLPARLPAPRRGSAPSASCASGSATSWC